MGKLPKCATNLLPLVFLGPSPPGTSQPPKEAMFLNDIDLDTRTQEILLAASNHDLDTLKPFLCVPGAASVQDIETGFTPLHAAIAACGHASQRASDGHVKIAGVPVNDTTNGHSHESNDNEDGEDEPDLEKAKATVRELFLSGAIWNDLDVNDETPGCLAWRLEQKELYEMVVEAGVRAELLMNLMGEYQRLPDEDDEEEAKNQLGQITEPDQPSHSDEARKYTIPKHSPYPEPYQRDEDVNSEDYLQSSLTFTPTKLVDASSNGVMMAWETPIMSLSAQLLASSPSLRILNIGFGMGIIDRFFAATTPSSHHIIEAHPDVIARLHSSNASIGGGAEGGAEDDNFAFFGSQWLREGEGKRNFLHEGRWQDVIPRLLEEGIKFDVIYFDTFGEDYSMLKMFFTEYVVELLSPEGRFGFFNGLGADRRVCYDVYCRVVELDLCDAGLDVEWVDVDVDTDDETIGFTRKIAEGRWDGVKRKYWTLERYRLPICKFSE